MKKSGPRSRVSGDGVEQEQDQDRTRNNSIESSSASAIPKHSPPGPRNSAGPSNNDGPPQPFSNGFWDKSTGMIKSRKIRQRISTLVSVHRWRPERVAGQNPGRCVYHGGLQCERAAQPNRQPGN